MPIQVKGSLHSCSQVQYIITNLYIEHGNVSAPVYHVGRPCALVELTGSQQAGA